jgi:phage major head subunit gpT-like protein
MVTGNVKMDDGKAFFSTEHKNIAETADILSDTTLTSALIAFKNQVDIDGNRKIRVQPKMLIVSPDYEIAARKLLTVIAPTNTGEVNVWASMGLTLIVEPRLSGKVWYMSADPNAIDSLYYANLDGQDGLRSNREEDFDTDSVKFAVRGEFGVAAIDYRGWYKNAGE